MSQLSKLNSTFETLNYSLNQYGINLPDINFLESNSYQYAKQMQQELLFQINTSLESYNDLINDGPVPRESEGNQTQRHLRKFLEKFGLSVSTKVFSDFTDRYLIEVYSKNHQQLYRSINFFNVSSYDLGSLTFVPWDKLFYRSNEDTERLLKAANFVVDNNIDYMTPNIPVHFLTELCTNKKFGYRMHKLATVTDSATGVPMGYLTVISVKEVLEAFEVLH